MKRVIVGLVWTAVFYIGLVLVIGIVGTQILETSTMSFQEGLAAGDTFAEKYVVPYRLHILIISVVLAAIGTTRGILPGTKVSDSDK